MAIDYVKVTTTGLFETATTPPKEALCSLLWGDQVQVVSSTVTNKRIRVRARGREGFVAKADLGGTALLEVYFIDVGQGDGVLVCTPDRRHVMIDGGYKRAAQPSGKNAADFVDWKFVKDYRRQDIELDAMIASHNDADHYGGLWDLVNPGETRELDAKKVKVKAFYHAGVCWLKDSKGTRSLGRKKDGKLIDLLEDGASLKKLLKGHGPYLLQGNWAEFLKCVDAQGCTVERLSHRTGYLPGFKPKANAASIRVLGPVEFAVDGQPALESLGSDSQNTNGNSVVLRLDYGRVRILLTGDLNKASQAVLLEHYTGSRAEFAADAIKSCHHGSDDCSFEFLKTVGAAATVISSGDAETHSHPRPKIVAASALTGHVRVEKDEVVTPLIYSTEISRSHKLGKIVAVRGAGGAPVPGWEKLEAEASEVAAGALRGAKKFKKLGDSMLLTGLVYGLVNVRTDGRRIVCATLNEGSQKWDIEEFESRF